MASDNKFFEDMSRVANSAFGTILDFKKECDSFVQQGVDRAVGGFNMVSRDEYEAVKALAVKAREEQHKLEKRIIELEKKLGIAQGSNSAQKASVKNNKKDNNDNKQNAGSAAGSSVSKVQKGASEEAVLKAAERSAARKSNSVKPGPAAQLTKIAVRKMDNPSPTQNMTDLERVNNYSEAKKVKDDVKKAKKKLLPVSHNPDQLSESRVKAKVKPEAKVKSETKAKPEAKVKSEANVKPEAKTKPEAKAKPEG